MNTLYGLQKVYSGQLAVESKQTNEMNDIAWSDLRASKISIVFQDMELLEEHSMMENILVKAELTSFYPVEKIIEFATQLDMQHHLQTKVNILSYGERQRVAIIRALMQDFNMLLLDEPFSHLDEKNIALASALILNEVKHRKAGLILADLEDDDRFPYHHKLKL